MKPILPGKITQALGMLITYTTWPNTGTGRLYDLDLTARVVGTAGSALAGTPSERWPVTLAPALEDYEGLVLLANYSPGPDKQADRVPLYKWGFEGGGIQTLYDAEARVKVLRSIHRTLDKAATIYGQPVDFAQWVAYVADAVGARDFFLRSSQGEGSMLRYSSRPEWRFEHYDNAPMVMRHIREMWRAHQEAFDLWLAASQRQLTAEVTIDVDPIEQMVANDSRLSDLAAVD